MQYTTYYDKSFSNYQDIQVLPKYLLCAWVMISFYHFWRSHIHHFFVFTSLRKDWSQTWKFTLIVFHGFCNQSPKQIPVSHNLSC